MHEWNSVSHRRDHGDGPNFPKVAPVHRLLGRLDTLRPLLVPAGQHYDLEMCEVLLRDLRLPQPDSELAVGSASHAVRRRKS